MIAAAFGVFKPAMVGEAVDAAWAVTDAAHMVAASEKGAVASLARIFGDDPTIAGAIPRATELLKRAAAAAPPGEGRALVLRPHRRSATRARRSATSGGRPISSASTGATATSSPGSPYGLDPVQATLTTELWWRLPFVSYVRTRGWNDDEIAGAVDRLRGAGLVDGDEFTDAGERLRADIEWCTDQQERPDRDGPRRRRRGAPRPARTDGRRRPAAAGGYPADPRTMTRP